MKLRQISTLSVAVFAALFFSVGSALAQQGIVKTSQSLTVVDLFAKPDGEVIGAAESRAVEYCPIDNLDNETFVRTFCFSFRGKLIPVWIKRQDVIIGEVGAEPQSAVGSDLDTGGGQGLKGGKKAKKSGGRYKRKGRVDGVIWY